MAELDLETTTKAPAPAPGTGRDAGGSTVPSTSSIAVIGAGRAGRSLAGSLRAAGHRVVGPLGRDDCDHIGQVDVVLICVPDSSIADVIETIPAGPTLAHCCGAISTAIFDGRSGFCLHPLMTLTGSPGDLEGAWAAVDGTGEVELALAESLARSIGLTSVRIAAEDRAAYHAAASIASNLLVTLEAAAQELAATAGLPAEALHPLVARTVSNVATLGPEAALTGPIARGDVETVERQRAEIEERTPQLLGLFDALCEATQRLATTGSRT